MTERTPSRLAETRYALLNLGIFAALAVVLLLLVLRQTGGRFTYCLDDPYIHLALAERIRHGLYGLNAGEPASPSSSLIWPLLLVPFAGTRVMPYLPLAINLICGGVSAYLLGRFAGRFAPPLGARGAWRSTALSVLLVLATNLLGIAFTGLEHSLEALLAIAASFALVHALEGEPLPWWSLAAAAMLPSVRYEGVLVAFAVAVTLWAVHRRTASVLLLAGSGTPLLLFGLFLRHLGLPFEPMSVLVKASYKFKDGSVWPVRMVRILLHSAHAVGNEPERIGVFLLTVSLLWLAWRSRRTRSSLLVLSGAAVLGLVQVLFGPFGWFYRYEVYAVALLLPVALAAELRTPAALGITDSDLGTHSRPDLDLSAPYMRAETLLSHPLIPGSLLLLVGALALFYTRPLLGVPQAALGIYEEQAQMARLVHGFHPGPVAVNDLGLVSFERPPQQYVLDLAGLGSYESFRAGEAGRTPQWLAETAERHGIDLVMIYPEWFKLGLPGTWTPVARLCAADANTDYSIFSPRVILFATPLTDRGALDDELRRFRAGLPRGTSLQTLPPNVEPSVVIGTSCSK